MRKFINCMLFSLLAVGWACNVFAQSATYKAADLAGKTYTWTDGSGNPQESPYVVFNQAKQLYETPMVTDAHQIYGLLRSIYMDPSFPGPWQSAYSKTGQREDDIFYGGCDNGWNIPGTYTGGNTSTIGALTITITNNSNSNPLRIYDIRITCGGNTLIGKFDTDAGTTPSNWTVNTGYGTMSSRQTTTLSDGSVYYYRTFSRGATITIPASVTAGYNNVEVVIDATGTGTISVNNSSKSIDNSTVNADFCWNFNTVSHKTYASNTYKPTEDGYTAIVVSMKNTTTPYIEPEYGSGGSTGFNTPEEVIDYISKTIEYVKLLTDGLRITDAGGNPGTVFNCDGTYNKFFFLGKGKARQKGAEVQQRINNNSWPSYAGECIAFWPLFEEFSPTSGDLGSEITDFFDLLMEGNVYSVVHDCAGVMQNKHEFSLAGEDKLGDYPFSGLNFFIPDYRLKYYELQNGSYTVDGRNMNPIYDINGTTIRDIENDFYYCKWAQYNPDHAPKVGIYKITLEAVATQVADVHEPGNQNYVVTLTWVSSLNQMAGTDIPQVYTVYYYDPVTGERKYVVAEGITDGKTGLTTVSYPWEQQAHSVVIDHVVEGRPNDSDHPTFVATSNHSAVVIPGWDDFVGLVLDHHESDFVISENSRDNWYRNFLAVINSDKHNGLTIDQVRDGMNTFNLYRQELKNDAWSGNVKIATITFDQIQADQVHYTITYEPGQEILESPKYTRSTMEVPDQGWVRVKGNGDLVIWPNGFFVNFKSIVIKNGNTVLAQWNASSANVNTDNPNLPNGWELSPGSKMMPYINSTNDEKVCYIEGGGYIYIPNMVTTANSNITVEIVAYTDGAHVGRIEVNDKSLSITNAAATYIWGGNGENQTPLNPSAAPKHDNNETNTKVTVNPSASSNKSQNSSRGANHSNVTNNSNKR